MTPKITKKEILEKLLKLNIRKVKRDCCPVNAYEIFGKVDLMGCGRCPYLKSPSGECDVATNKDLKKIINRRKKLKEIEKL